MARIEESFRSLRVALETRISGPSIIAVTCAQAGDGSTTVATGLAEAFAEAGHQTLFVSALTRNDVVHIGGISRTGGSSVAAIGSRVPGHPNLAVATAEQLTAGLPAGRLALSRTLAMIRENFAVVVVDAEPVTTSSLACELARDADAVLVALRLGRSPSREDRAAMKLLDDCNANVVGVVPTTSRTRSFSLPETTPVAAPARTDVDVLPKLAPRQVEVG